METRNFTRIILALMISLSSCTMQKNSLPDAKGKAGEIIVLIDKHLWDGPCGDTIRRALSGPILTMPTAEPMFTLLQQNSLSDMMQTFRNILIVKIDNSTQTGQLTYKTDVWAKNQLVFNVTAPSADSAAACVLRNQQLMIAHYIAKDRDSHITYFTKNIEKSIAKRLQEKFQVDVVIPKDYSLDVDRDNFVWMAREEGDMTLGILMWKEPYTSEKQLETNQLIVKMNEVTKANVPGPDEGSYMADEPMIPAEVRRFNKEGIYNVQINGLWQMENGFMGGPYANFTIVDEKRGQLVTGVGFVFYPRKQKRSYMRQLEAILYTMKPAEATDN